MPCSPCPPPVAGRLERRVGPKPLLVAGAVIISAAYLAAVLLDLNMWLVLSINTVIVIGIGLGYAAMPTLIMQAVPIRETGAANGMNTLMRALGTSIAAAVIAAVLANSATKTAMGSVPTGSGFELALLLGLAAVILCTVLATLIRMPKAATDEEPALPEDVLPAR